MRRKYPHFSAGLVINHAFQTILHSMPYLNSHFSKPAFIGLSVNDACNLRCLQCSFWKFKEMGKSTEDLQEIIRKLREWLGPFHLTITGGEPLLRHDIPELVETAQKLGIMVNLVTNGTLLTKRTAERLKEAGLSTLTVSLDGATDGTHDYIRGLPQTRDKVVKNILYAKSLLPIQIATILFNRNLKEAPELVRWAQRERFIGVIFQPVIMDFGRNRLVGNFPTYLLPGKPEEVSSAIGSLITMKKEGYRVLNSFDHLRLMELYLRNPGSIAGLPSSVGFGQVAINAAGRMTIGSTLTSIDILACNDLKKMWASSELRETRRAARRKLGPVALLNCFYSKSLREKAKGFLIRMPWQANNIAK